MGAAVGAGAALGVSAAKEGGLQTSIKDEAIRIKISDIWFKRSTDIFGKLNLTVNQGRVLVTGVVQNPEDRVEAIRLSWQPKGVKQVINEIRIGNSSFQRLVAIKTMRIDEADDAEKLQEVKSRFFREAESTGRLAHPNIVTIYDAGEEQDLGYIAMEVLEGTTLKHWSRKPNLLPLDKLIPILATVADALAASALGDPGIAGYAVYGERVTLATPLRDGDRLELLRPLLIDPKEARRRRAQDQRSRSPETRRAGK